MSRRNLFFILIIILLFSSGVMLDIRTKSEHTEKNTENKILVTTTLFPLYDFIKNIGGDFVDVSLLLPPGTEPHSFEPKPSDMIRINSSDIFVYTGKFMETWAEDVINGMTNKNVRFVDVSSDIVLLKDTASKNIDPHIWLDFDNDKKIIHTLTNALVEADPSHTAYYRNREEDYVEKFAILDNEYALSLGHCKTRTVVYGGHYAFGYLMSRYNLQYLAAQGISPDAEPTPNDLVTLIQQVKENAIQYIFYEELTSPKIAETIANETGMKMILLNAGHNVSKEDVQNNVSFLDIMRENKMHLVEGLQCE